MAKQIGFIGVGNMGRGMVRNLLKAGYTVRVFDLNPEAVSAVEKDGAIACSSVKEVAEPSEVVLTSLPSVAAFTSTVLNEDGVIANMASGGYLIDMSTIDAGTTRKVHEEGKKRGIKTLDAPVSGGPQGAAAGTLSIMVGGDAADFEACKPIFEAMGKNIVYCGRSGAGQIVKLCNNMLGAAHTVALGEALITGVKAGVSLDVLVKAIRTSSGNSWILENFATKTIFKGDYTPLFHLNLMHKDVGLYLRTAEEAGVPSFIGSLTYQLYNTAKINGKGSLDHTAVCQMLEEIANSRIGTLE